MPLGLEHPKTYTDRSSKAKPVLNLNSEPHLCVQCSALRMAIGGAQHACVCCCKAVPALLVALRLLLVVAVGTLASGYTTVPSAVMNSSTVLVLIMLPLF